MSQLASAKLDSTALVLIQLCALLARPVVHSQRKAERIASLAAQAILLPVRATPGTTGRPALLARRVTPTQTCLARCARGDCSNFRTLSAARATTVFMEAVSCARRACVTRMQGRFRNALVAT